MEKESRINLNTKAYIVGDNIISSLGFTTEENILNLEQDISRISKVDNPSMLNEAVCCSLVNSENLKNGFNDTPHYTRLEKLFITSISSAIENSGVDLSNPRTALLISTTKGNIDVLEGYYGDEIPKNRMYLGEMAKAVGGYFNIPNEPIVVSNACISGVLAIVTAKRIIDSGQFDHVVVAGGDIISKFTLSGFTSFMAISSEPCKPYDKNRNGITLGEGVGTLVISKAAELAGNKKIAIIGGATSNDGNHISGPSRTGDGLHYSIQGALKEAKNPTIDHINAHGTATTFNDEMESKAFNLSGMKNVPINSLKGYFGHTLGAAGTIESIALLHSLRNNTMFNTKGFDQLGVPESINVIKGIQNKELVTAMKTASGFGGCNAAVIFRKDG